MGEPEITAMVSGWRRQEQRLEAGLDPELARKLDELRTEHARLIARSQRTPAVWNTTPTAVPSIERVAPAIAEPTLRRTG